MRQNEAPTAITISQGTFPSEPLSYSAHASRLLHCILWTKLVQLASLLIGPRTRKGNLSIAFAIPFVLLGTGCMHRPLQIKQNYVLETTSGFSLLVPSVSPKTVDGDFQTSLVKLTDEKRSIRSTLPRQCSIKGSTFSFGPDDPTLPNQWLVKSPSVQGWSKHGGEINLGADWSQFTHDLHSLDDLGCFPRGESLAAVTRAIVERMPLPASESLLFFYSFGGGGFANLATGMQVKVERPLFENNGRDKAAGSYRGSLVAQYEVVPTSQTGVALRLSKTENRRSGRKLGAEASAVFGLSARFATRPMLRLFLQSLNDNNSLRSPILIGGSNVADLDTATYQIERNSSGGCPVGLPTAIDCISFGEKTAVSLLASVWINGRLLYRPLGTTVGYMIETLSKSGSEQARALETISVRRPLTTGGYAAVNFPKTLASANQVILLNGDRLSWKH